MSGRGPARGPARRALWRPSSAGDPDRFRGWFPVRVDPAASTAALASAAALLVTLACVPSGVQPHGYSGTFYPDTFPPETLVEVDVENGSRYEVSLENHAIELTIRPDTARTVHVLPDDLGPSWYLDVRGFGVVRRRSRQPEAGDWVIIEIREDPDRSHVTVR